MEPKRTRIIYAVCLGILLFSNLATRHFSKQGAFNAPAIDRSTPDNAVKAYHQTMEALAQYADELRLRHTEPLTSTSFKKEPFYSAKTLRIEKVDEQSSSRAEVFANVTRTLDDKSSDIQLKYVLAGTNGKWAVESMFRPCACKDEPGQCYSCHGSANCPECRGSGQLYGVSDCFYCKSTGRCKTCEGTGRCQSCPGTGWQDLPASTRWEWL